MSDQSIISAIGHFIQNQRLEQNISQEELAQRAGLNRWTIGQIEKGESTTLTSLIKILRVLNSLNILKIFEIHEKISPIEYAKLKEQSRKRARTRHKSSAEEKGLEW